MCLNRLELKRPASGRDREGYNPSRRPTPVVRCTKCSECVSERVNDWVGRCMAEADHATAGYSLTLTYADDHGSESPDAHKRLFYPDFQRFLKRLRFDGYKVRYLVAGEYGSRRKRAHWHTVLFFSGAVPEFELDQDEWMWSMWPHGFTYGCKADGKAYRYVCKYIAKDQFDPEFQQNFHMSKKPPLGAEFFKQLARSYVDKGIFPHNPEYWFADNTVIRKVKLKPGQENARGSSVLVIREPARNGGRFRGSSVSMVDLEICSRTNCCAIGPNGGRGGTSQTRIGWTSACFARRRRRSAKRASTSTPITGRNGWRPSASIGLVAIVSLRRRRIYRLQRRTTVRAISSPVARRAMGLGLHGPPGGIYLVSSPSLSGPVLW